MIHKYVSPSHFQASAQRSRGALHVFEKGANLPADSFYDERFVQIDKRTLTAFLQESFADALARGKTINLDTNQELTRMIPVICTYFSHSELVQLVGKKATEKILELQRTELLQNLFLERELQQVLHAFNEASIRLLLFKGPALAYTVYPQAHLRTYHDIDALIHPHDLARAHNILTQMGYTFYEEFATNAVDSERVGYNYTLKRPDSWLEVLLELHTAFHTSEIGTLFNVESLWAQAQPITVLGERTLTLGVVDHLLYLCWHYRFHGFTRLLWLYDLVVLLRVMGDEMAWDAVVQVAREQHIAATLYYCLLWCRDLFEVPVPKDVLADLRPPLMCRFIVERIAMPDVLKTLTAAPLLSRRMIARRAMNDSQLELMKAGLRMLFPSPTALVRRYMSHSRLPLQLFFVFYLIHPWVTLVKGCRDLLRRRLV